MEKETEKGNPKAKAKAKAKVKAGALKREKARKKENLIPNQGQISDVLKTPVVAKIAAEIADEMMIQGHAIKEMLVLTLVAVIPCLVDLQLAIHLFGGQLFVLCLARRKIVEKKLVDEFIAACKRSLC